MNNIYITSYTSGDRWEMQCGLIITNADNKKEASELAKKVINKRHKNKSGYKIIKTYRGFA